MKLMLEAADWMSRASEPTAAALAAAWDAPLGEVCMLLLRAQQKGYVSRERERASGCDGCYRYTITPSGERAVAYARAREG